MVRSSGSNGSQRAGYGGSRRIHRQRRYTHRPLPPLDLRSPSGRTVYPY